MSKTLLHGINYIKTLDQWSSTFLAPWTIFSTRSLLVYEHIIHQTSVNLDSILSGFGKDLD